MKIILIKQFDNSFKPAYDMDLEKLKRIKPNEFIECEIKKKRNIKFHRKFFALIDLVYQNQSTYINSEDLRADLIITAGYYTTYINIEGNVVKKADSISFAQMDEHSFNEFYSKIIDVIVLHFNFNKQLLIDEIEQFF